MITPLGGRESIIKNARQACIILGEEERNTIAEQKGDSSISEFIRDSIMMRAPDSKVLSDQTEIKELREENIQMLHELERYKAKEHTITKEKEDAMAYISQGFELYNANSKRSQDPGARQSWVASRAKSSGLVTTAEVISHLEVNGLW